jgi:hypothetical protein
MESSERATASRPGAPTRATVSRPRREARNRMPGRPRGLLANWSFAPALLFAWVALGAFLSLTPGSH